MFDQNKNFYLPIVFASLLFMLVFFDALPHVSNEAKNNSLSAIGNTSDVGLEFHGLIAEQTFYPPKQKQEYVDLNISALSFLSAYIDDKGAYPAIILAEKNRGEKAPIASITKLMTAVIASENMDEEKEIKITKNIIEYLGDDNSKRFLADTNFKAKDLLRAMLIESNNDAAESFAAEIGKDKFMRLMNERASEFGMGNTFFANPAGLDPVNQDQPMNHSTPEDLMILTRKIIEKYPEILDAMSLKEYDIYKSSGGFNHKAVNTNKLLEESLTCNGNALKIFGGKTGTTDYAKRNLLLITESPNDEGFLVNIILGSDDNFSDMKNLVGWVCDSYEWQ